MVNPRWQNRTFIVGGGGRGKEVLTEVMARREEVKQSLNSRFKPVIKSMVLNYKI